jgi:hypothetical protein
MKSQKLIPLYLALLLVISGMLGGCKKVENGLSSVTWEINFDLVTTTWDIQFIDAATGLPIGANSDDRVAATITGDDQVSILDLAGVRQPVFYSSKGAIALALHPNRPVPDVQNPVRFVIHASHPSYLPASMPVMAFQGGINPIRIFLVSRTQAPVNVDLLNKPAAALLADNRLVDSLKAATPAKSATLQMSAGTEVLAANGGPMAGNLNLAFSYWEGGTTNGLKTFPGGQLTVNSTGKPGLIYLACGIYTDLTDQDGKVASTVSRPMEFTALINPAVYNPYTKARLVAGEAVPLWFLNPESGVWVNKGTTILQAHQDKLMAGFTMESPGLILVGWINESLCASPLVLHPNTLPEYNVIPYTFNLNIFEVYENEFRFVRSIGISGQVTQDYTLRFLPDNSELVFRFEPYTGEDKPYYKAPDPILLAGFCESGSPVSFDLLPKPNSTIKKIKVVFIDVEHNNTRYNPKVFPGYYRKTGTTTWQSAFVYNGQAFMVNPVQGDLYQMGINYKGEFHMKEVTVGPEDVVLVEIAID